MNKHECDLCNYATNSNKDFERHINAKKHISTAKDEMKCRYCLKKLSSPQSLHRHEKANCKSIFSNIDRSNENDNDSSESKNKTKKKSNDIDELKKTIDELKEQLKNKEINELKNEIKELKKDKEYFKKTVTQAGKIMTNLSNIDWIRETYTNALPFTKLKEEDILTAFRIKEEKNIKKYLLENKNEKECFKDQLIYYKRNNILASSFCDLITKTYKKENNPELQSMWVCDVPRNNYAIREEYDDDILSGDDEDMDNNDDETISARWISDKQGNKIEAGAILPILEFSNKVLSEFLGDATKNTERDMKSKVEAIEIIGEIKTEKFKNKLKNKLAGHFQLKRK